jgi:hypothetical protein
MSLLALTGMFGVPHYSLISVMKILQQLNSVLYNNKKGL